MENINKNNISKVHIEIEKEAKSIKIGSLVSAFASLTGATAISLFSFPLVAAAAGIVGAAGIGLTLKYLFDKLSIEYTEKQFNELVKNVEKDDKIKKELEDLISKNDDKELLNKIKLLLEQNKK